MMNAVTDITGLAHITCPDALRDLPAWVCWRYEPNDNPGGSESSKEGLHWLGHTVNLQALEGAPTACKRGV